MASIGITTYSFQIKLREDGLEHSIDLNSLQGKTIIEIMIDFINENLDVYENNSRLEKIFKFESLTSDERIRDGSGDSVYFKYVFGKVKTGDYGVESEIVDPNRNSTVYNKSKNEAEVMPFTLLLAVPVGFCTKGILILQNIGRYGIKTILLDQLKKYFRIHYPNYKIYIGNLLPEKYLKKWFEEGILQKIRLLKYKKENDLSERIDSEPDYTCKEIVYHNPNKLRILQNALEYINNAMFPYHSIVDVNDFEYDDLKFQFKLGKKTKTINIKNVDNLIINEDITNNVEIGEGGHPLEDSILEIMEETALGYMQETGFLVCEGD